MQSKKLSFLVVVVVLLQIYFTNAQNTINLDDYDPDIYAAGVSRVVNGKPVNIRQVPWQVALLYYGSQICGGSMISKDWILTAAHCVKGGGKFSVRAGSQYSGKGGQVRNAEKTMISNGYDSNSMNHDIAMIKVEKPFEITEFARPILLAKTGREMPERYFVSGWGSLNEGGAYPRHLQGVTVKRVFKGKCQEQYDAYNYKITKFMICAAWPDKERDSCQGDSGGPLTRDNIQYGIVSFGIGCARPNFAGVYTKVAAVNEFIKETVQKVGGAMPKFA